MINSYLFSSLQNSTILVYLPCSSKSWWNSCR